MSQLKEETNAMLDLLGFPKITTTPYTTTWYNLKQLKANKYSTFMLLDDILPNYDHPPKPIRCINE